MRLLRRMDLLLLAAMVALIVTGVVFIRSAGAARSIAALQTAWRAHAWTAVAGLGLYFALAAVDYRRLLDWGVWPFYVFSAVLLAVVLFAGSTVYGGKRWLWFFQPSEVAKLAVIAALASVFGGETRRWGGGALRV